MANSADPDQLASSEANWSGSIQFAKAGYIRVQQDKGYVPVQDDFPSLYLETIDPPVQSVLWVHHGKKEQLQWVLGFLRHNPVAMD